MKRLPIMLVCLAALSGCMQTVNGALQEGGVKLTADLMNSELSGLNAKARFVQGYVATHRFAFSDTSDSFSVDAHDGGRWYASGDGLLCLDWPKSLGWSRKGYCFTALKERDGFGLYDTTVDQLRVKLTPL